MAVLYFAPASSVKTTARRASEKPRAQPFAPEVRPRVVWCHGVCRTITCMLQRRGVLELFHEEDEAYVKTLSANNWGAVALSKAKFVQVRGGMLRHSPNLSAMPPRDVLVLFHAVDSRDSMAFTPYFKKMARQFKSLNLPSLVVARYDVSDVSPPRDVRLTCVVCAV